MWEERDLTASQLSALRGKRETNTRRGGREIPNRLIGHAGMRTDMNMNERNSCNMSDMFGSQRHSGDNIYLEVSFFFLLKTKKKSFS